VPYSPEILIRQMLELEAADAPDWDRVVAVAAELRAGIEGGVLEGVVPIIHSYLSDVELRRSNRESGVEHFALKQAESVSKYLAGQQSREAA